MCEILWSKNFIEENLFIKFINKKLNKSILVKRSPNKDQSIKISVKEHINNCTNINLLVIRTLINKYQSSVEFSLIG